MSRNQDRDDGNANERPWNEAEWAKFMKEGDVRAARYGELLETFRDEPDCHEKVAREMGWDVDDAEGTPDEDYDFARTTNDLDMDDRFEEAVAELEAALDGNSPSEAEAGVDADDDDSFDYNADQREGDAIPAYTAARDCGMLVDRILRPWMDQSEDQKLDERIPDIWTNIHIAAAKIRGGHAMGYEDEVLCGNIVCNTIAQHAVELCIQHATELAQEQILPRDKVDQMLPELKTVHQAITARVAELRARVWW